MFVFYSSYLSAASSHPVGHINHGGRDISFLHYAGRHFGFEIFTSFRLHYYQYYN